MHDARMKRHGDVNFTKLNMHGRSYSKEYQIYKNMRARCFYESHPQYKDWGGRGITVCDRWLGTKGFTSFLQDMGEKPEGKTIDRINNDGNYEPNNVRWATRRQQFMNRRFTKKAKSGFTGVFPNGNSWYCRASIGGKEHYIGSYKTPQEASEARENYIKEHA
jgi:hypothetical protein